MSLTREEILCHQYESLQREIAILRSQLHETEKEMLALKPVGEWNMTTDNGKIRPTNSHTHFFEVDDEPLRFLADNPHIPMDVRKRVIRMTPSSISELKGLAAYGSEERRAVEECLAVVGTKTRLSYQQKKE